MSVRHTDDRSSHGVRSESFLSRSGGRRGNRIVVPLKFSRRGDDAARLETLCGVQNTCGMTA